jgi:myo-inositol-1(or 4)-monophosphatase
MGEMERIREVAKKTAREAGRIALDRLAGTRKIARKSGETDLVTDVDKECEKTIIERIKKEFPSHSILAEESGKQISGDEYCWIIDPVDGTTNYAHRFPVFCVSLGVRQANAVKTGVVYDPTRDEMFEACEGRGAFLNGSRIEVSGTDLVKNALLATGFAYNAEGRTANIDYFINMLKSAQAVRRLGSAALDLCYVACGRLDGFWEIGLQPWDTAAGQLILQEAGGRITTIKGEPFDIFREELLATNGQIHDEMIYLLTHR